MARGLAEPVLAVVEVRIETMRKLQGQSLKCSSMRSHNPNIHCLSLRVQALAAEAVVVVVEVSRRAVEITAEPLDCLHEH